MSSASSPRLLLLAGLTGFLLLGCKQGAGERCELDSDCKSGLSCSTSGTAGVCSSSSGGGTGGSTSTPGTGGAGVPDAGGTGGGGGSAAPDVNRDVADTAAPVETSPEVSPADADSGVDAVDARDGQAG